MRIAIAAAAGALLLTTPAWAAKQVITPSGQPDAVFQGTTLADVASKIANHCMNKGWAIASQTPNQIVCEVPVGAMQAAFQQLLLGNSYSTTPRSFARFSLAQLGDNARVQAAAWVETQMAFGQMRQQPYTDDNTFNGLEGFLLEAGGQLPPGSRIPGNYIGFEGEPQIEGKKVSIPVTSVVSSGPGAAAGLKVGDRIVKVNGQAFKNQEDFTKKLNKIGTGVRYALIVEREGAPVTLTVLAQERPVVGTPEWTAMEAEVRAARMGTSTSAGPGASSDKSP